MKRILSLSLFLLAGCAPVSPSAPKAYDPCAQSTSNYNSVNAGDSQYEVQTKMGQSPSSEVTTFNQGTTQIVDTYFMCREFVYSFDYSGHLVSKSMQ